MSPVSSLMRTTRSRFVKVIVLEVYLFYWFLYAVPNPPWTIAGRFAEQNEYFILLIRLFNVRFFGKCRAKCGLYATCHHLCQWVKAPGKSPERTIKSC